MTAFIRYGRSIVISGFILLLFLSSPAQTTFPLTFDSKGKLRPEVTEKLNGNDKLTFKVLAADESLDKYIKQYKTKLEQAKKSITTLKSNADKMKMLQDIYGITATDIDNVNADIDAVIAAPSTASPNGYVPHFAATAGSYFTAVVTTGNGTSNASFAPNSASTAFACTQANDEKELDFVLSKTDPFKKMLFDWLSTTKGDFSAVLNTGTFQDYKMPLAQKTADIKAFAGRVESFFLGRTLVNKDTVYLKKVIDTATKLQTDFETLLGSIRTDIDIHAYKLWILKWLWYQAGSFPSLNPLPFRRSNELGDEPDTSALDGLRQRIAAREAYIGKLDLTKVNVRQLDSLIAGTDSLKCRITAIKKASDDYVQLKTKNEQAAKSFASTSSQLNKGILFVGDKAKSIFWMRHHDASNNQGLMNGATADEYLESDRIVILSHNLAVTEKASVQISFVDITDDHSPLAEAVSSALGQVSSTLKLFPIVPAVGVTPPPLAVYKSEVNKRLTQLKTSVRDAQPYGAYLDYLASQHNPALDNGEATDESISFHSQVANPAKKIGGPKKATYYLSTASSVNSGAASAVAAAATPLPAADTFTYRINKLYRIFPMAGLNVTTNTLGTVSYDSATKQSSMSTENHVHLVVGLKIYLRKTDIRNPQFITGKDENGRCLFLSRTSIGIAFDASKPLDNIYGGLGFDLWPGCCVNTGILLNRYKYVQYAEGKAIKQQTLYRPGFYLGISTDVSLFTDIAKLLNLTK